MLKKIILLSILLLAVLAVSIYFLPGVRQLLGDAILMKKVTTLIKAENPDLLNSTSNAVSTRPPVAIAEPSIDKIKADLIGRAVPGWTFDKVTEFQKATITSIARTDAAIEYRVDLLMVPYNTTAETTYDLQIIATYIREEHGWSFLKVEELLLSFEILIPPGESVRVTSLPECRLMPDAKNRLFWTSPAWDYEILSGPGYSGITLPVADSYDVRSKSKNTVKTKVSFRPNSAPD